MIERARNWKEGADRLLAESKLADLLQRHGEVHFSGGYAYNVMMAPDIDIHLLVPEFTKTRAVKVHLSLVDQGWWATITFADWVEERFRPPTLSGVPRGYYVGVETQFDAVRWKVDIWVLDRTSIEATCGVRSWSRSPMSSDWRSSTSRRPEARGRSPLLVSKSTKLSSTTEYELSTSSCGSSQAKRTKATWDETLDLDGGDWRPAKFGSVLAVPAASV